MSELQYDVMVHEGLRRQRQQRLPDGSPIVSSPVASTLIYGDHDAVLVDPPFSREQVQRVGDWIENSSKKLTEQKYPIILREEAGRGHEYLTRKTWEELVRWIDSLDRI